MAFYFYITTDSGTLLYSKTSAEHEKQHSFAAVGLLQAFFMTSKAL